MKTPRVAAVVVGLNLVVGPSTHLTAGVQEGLELQAVTSYVLPDSFRVTGLAASPSGVILAWSRDPGTVLILESDGIDQFDPASEIEPIGGWVSQTADVIEILDRSSNRLLRASRREHTIRETTFRIPLDLRSASRSPVGWYIGGVTARGQFAVYLLGEEGSTQRVVVFPRNQAPGSTEFASISTAGSDVLVTRMTDNYAVYRVSATGSVVLEMEPDAAALPRTEARAGESPAQAWVSLPALALDYGYVQTIADVTGDRRRLVRYDSDGRALVTRELDIPMGLVHSVPSARILVGAMNVPTTEVTVYRWRWLPGPESPSPDSLRR